MLELVMIRHGETAGNIKKTYMGWTDFDLTDDGIRQAERVRDLLSGEDFLAVYSSPQKRAFQTAEIICRGNNMFSGLGEQRESTKRRVVRQQQPVIKPEEGLRERNFGIFDNLTYEEIKDRYPKEHDAWTSDWINYRIPDGESASEVYQRVSGFLTELKNTDEKDVCKKILLVTHKGWIMNAAAYLLGLTIEGIWHFHVDPGRITRFEIRDGFCVMKLLNG